MTRSSPDLPLLIIPGDVFERWTVVKRAPSRARNTLWLCKCECGTEREVRERALVARKSRSCGCLRTELAQEAASAGRVRRPNPDEDGFYWRGRWRASST